LHLVQKLQIFLVMAMTSYDKRLVYMTRSDS
jgi:hypothetical protein